MRTDRSPDGAKRNPGRTFPQTATPAPDYATADGRYIRATGHADHTSARSFGVDARKHLLHQLLVKPVGAGEQAAEQGAVVGQHRIVAVLEQRGVVDLDLLAGHAPAFDGAAEHPIDAAVAVVGALVAVLPEGAAEFRDHHHERVIPRLRASCAGVSPGIARTNRYPARTGVPRSCGEIIEGAE